MLHGDLGYDYYKGEPVTSVIAQAAPATMSLVLGAAVLWICYGIFTGVVSAVKPRSLMDRALPRRRCSSTRCPHSSSACR